MQNAHTKCSGWNFFPVEANTIENTSIIIAGISHTEGSDATTNDGLLAGCTERALLRVVVLLTVGFVLVLEEASGERLAAVLSLDGQKKKNRLCKKYHADKARRMPLAPEARDAVGHDGLLAAAAFGCKHVEVVLLAVRLSVLFHEAALFMFFFF